MHQPQQEGYGAPAGGDAYASSTHPFALLQQTVNKEWVEANARRQSSMTAEQMGGEYVLWQSGCVGCWWWVGVVLIYIVGIYIVEFVLLFRQHQHGL